MSRGNVGFSEWVLRMYDMANESQECECLQVSHENEEFGR